MSRLVVMVLAAANLLYFGWTFSVGRGKPQLTAATGVPQASRPAQKSAVPAGPPPCATLGPFLDAALADTAEQELKDAGLGPRRRSASEEVAEGWWVYVANTDAATQARTLDTLRRWNMRDAVAMPEDPQFRVSVGIYSQQQRATDRAQLVQRLKLEARVTERHRPQPATWFDIPGVARAALADGRLRKMGLPLEKLRIEGCPAAQGAPGPAGGTSAGDESPGDPEEKPETGVADVAHPEEGAGARGV